MAQTVGPMNGTVIRVLVATNEIARCTSHSLSLSMNAIDVTSKDSNGWKEVLGGLREGSISFEGLLIESEGAGATGYNDLFDLVTSRAAVALEWTNENAGDSKFTCSAIITSLEQEAPMEDARTFSGEFTITGAVTKAVIS